MQEHKILNLSPGALRKAVLSQSAQHPSVVYPAALGALGAIAAAAVVPSPLLIGAAVVGGGAALAALLINVFGRHEDLAAKHLTALRERLAKERQAQIEDLAGDLAEVNSGEGGRQLGRFVEKLGTFQAILGEKLSPGELTYARFSAIAEAVFLAGVENLRAVHLAHKALDAIDETYLKRRIAELERAGAGDGRQVQGLRDQAEQAGQLWKRISDRLGENELALAELAKATSAIGEMRSGSAATMDMESAMAELARIAQRSTQY